MPYNAFLSYSHTDDSAIAAAIQDALHRFAKPWYKLRALHIFRDQTNLAVNPALWSSIRDALDQSLFCILIASPQAAASPWVSKEVEYWLQRNGPSHILIVLTGGVLKWDQAATAFTSETNALPPVLLHAFPEEPLYLDLSWARQQAAHLTLKEPRFHEAALQLAATLHNRPKDELDGTDVRLQRQARSLAVAAFMIIVITAAFALWQTRQSHSAGNEKDGADLAADSLNVLAHHPDQVRQAAILAVESNRLFPSFSANQALRASVSLLPLGAQFYNPQSADPSERVRDLAFSPDGAKLVAARDDGAVELFDLQKHERIGYIGPDETPKASIKVGVTSGEKQADNNAAVSVAFDAAGTLLASGAEDGLVHVWSYPDGRELLRVQEGSAVSQVAFRPRTNELAIAGEDGHVRLFNIAAAQATADLQCPDKVVSIAFGPDGRLLAASSSAGVISLFDIASKKAIQALSGGDAAFNVLFSGDGKRIASAVGDYALVWDTASGKQLLKATHAASQETLTPQQWITDVALTSDGKFLAYATKGDSFAHVWNVDTGRQILTLKHDAIVSAVAFSSDGTKLGTASYDGTARVWSLPSGSETGRAAHPQGAEVAVFSPDGQRFAAGGMEGTVSVSESGRADRPAYFEFLDDVRSVAFSPDGQRIAMASLSAHASPLIRVANIDGTAVREIEFHGAPVLDKITFLNHDQLLARWSSELFLINIDNASATHLPPQAREFLTDTTGRVLAFQQDSSTRLVSLPDVTAVSSLSGVPAKLIGIANGGKLLAYETSASPGNCFIDIWSASTKARVTRIRTSSEWNHLAFTQSGTLLFVTQAANLQAWEIPSGKLRFSITSDGSIEHVVPNEPAGAFATIAHQRVTVWDLRTRTALAEVPGSVASFSPDGRYVLSNDTAHSAALWLWRSNDLQDQACAHLGSNLSHGEWQRLLPARAYHQTCPNLAVPAN